MLRKIRIALAAVFFIGITLLFVGIGEQWWGWMAHLQFIPACLALNAGIIIAITLLTFVFGRLYCSVICPLGVFQDIVIAIRRRLGKKSRHVSVKHFAFNEERKWLRYTILGLLVISVIAGCQMLILLIAPYSAYGRMVGAIVNPHWGAVTIVAAVTFIGITVLSWKYGRAWCGNACPVGTVLSLFGRYSLFRPQIDTDKCISCGRCVRDCKCSCIDGKAHEIDCSRCVDCFDCLENCKEGAIRYRFAYGRTRERAEGKTDTSRRAFMSGALLLGASAAARAQMKLDGGLAAIEAKKVPERKGRLVPFGAGSVDNFYDHCTACQLCVSACPNKVLRPSSDLQHLMQPEMGYENGFCRPECTLCSQLCPSGAILPLSAEEKTAVHIGRATIDASQCIACGNCARHCPAGAILMVKSDPSDPASPKIPTVLEDKCIGCGACEYLCPVRPYSAIRVDGFSTHITD